METVESNGRHFYRKVLSDCHTSSRAVFTQCCLSCSPAKLPRSSVPIELNDSVGASVDHAMDIMCSGMASYHGEDDVEENLPSFSRNLSFDGGSFSTIWVDSVRLCPFALSLQTLSHLVKDACIMATSTASVFTWNLPWGSWNRNENKTASASVIGADATATTLYFPLLPNYPYDGLDDVTMTIGPWAPVSKPVTTGIVDVVLVTQSDQAVTQHFVPSTTINGTLFTYPNLIATMSIHCNVSVRSIPTDDSWAVAEACTEIVHDSYGGATTSTMPTSTIVGVPDVDFTIAPQIVAITAGLEKLAAATSAPNLSGAAANIQRVEVNVVGLLFCMVMVFMS
ncbi:hypothetical protein ANO11243_073450 [Dothideomycetidae sp. 11243]|nr:hypothetical protein ANO11243_073450 [fungal sp. No.11243]